MDHGDTLCPLLPEHDSCLFVSCLGFNSARLRLCHASPKAIPSKKKLVPLWIEGITDPNSPNMQSYIIENFLNVKVAKFLSESVLRCLAPKMALLYIC